MKKNLIIIFIFLIIFFILGCSKKKEPIRIGTNVWQGYEPLYLARTIGEYNDDFVKLIELFSATEVIRAYRNGVIDAGTLTLDEVLLLAEYEKDFYILFIMDYSNGGDVIVARPPIDSLEKIRGKKVGVENSAVGTFLLSRGLDFAKLTPKDLIIKPLHVDEHEGAYKRGEVDVIVTFEPVKTKLLNAGANLIFDSSQIPKEIVDVLIVRKNFLEKHPEIIKKLLSGWFNTLKFLETNPNKAYEIISKHLNISPSETKDSYKGLILPNLAENKNMLFNSSIPLLKITKLIANKMIENKILEYERNYEKIFLPSKFIKLFP